MKLPTKSSQARLMFTYAVALAVATLPMALMWVFDLGEIPRAYSLTIGALSVIMLAWNTVALFLRPPRHRRPR